MEKFYDFDDPGRRSRGKRTVIRKGSAPRDEKDPAAAYSRSIFYWGGGQFYNDEVGKGTIFLISAMVFLAGAVLAVIYWLELLAFLRDRNISVSAVFLATETVLFLALLFWSWNAADAYQHAARKRKTRFTGVRSRVTPVLGSLVVPGWGQFLNGQPLKGSIHAGLAVICVFSLGSVVLTFLVWPSLDATDSRFIIEGISAVSLLVLPAMPLLWSFSAYDALKVSIDELKKEPLWERLKAAYYRGRTQGWIQGVFPQVKGTLTLLLFLVFFAIVVYYWFPVSYYADLLGWAKDLLADRGMTIVPALFERALAWLAATGG